MDGVNHIFVADFEFLKHIEIPQQYHLLPFHLRDCVVDVLDEQFRVEVLLGCHGLHVHFLVDDFPIFDDLIREAYGSDLEYSDRLRNQHGHSPLQNRNGVLAIYHVNTKLDLLRNMLQNLLNDRVLDQKAAQISERERVVVDLFFRLLLS